MKLYFCIAACAWSILVMGSTPLKSTTFTSNQPSKISLDNSIEQEKSDLEFEIRPLDSFGDTVYVVHSNESHRSQIKKTRVHHTQKTSIQAWVLGVLNGSIKYKPLQKKIFDPKKGIVLIPYRKPHIQNALR